MRFKFDRNIHRIEKIVKPRKPKVPAMEGWARLLQESSEELRELLLAAGKPADDQAVESERMRQLNEAADHGLVEYQARYNAYD